MLAKIPSVGSRVRVITEHPNIYYLTAKTQPMVRNTYEGVVVPNEKFDKPNTFCITGNSIMPIRNIAVHNVVKLEIISGSASSININESVRVFKVQSSAKNKQYLVTLTQGKFSCNCIGFQYHKNCRHTKAVATKVNAK